METRSKYRRGLTMAAAAAALLLLAAGCSGRGSGSEPAANNDAAKPIEMPKTITMLNDDGLGDQLIIDLVKKKFPDLNFQIMKVKDIKPEELMVSGNFPDLMLASTTWYKRRFLPLQAEFDMSGLIKSKQLDLNQYESYIVDDIRKMSKNGGMVALPYYADFAGVTYYNKDIFDKFGIAYPKDGMYWEDYLQLSRQLTRSVDGVQYVGVDANPFRWGGNGLQPLGPKTDRAMLTANGWLELFNLMKQFYAVPGAEKDGKWATDKWLNAFFKDRTLAVLSYRNQLAGFIDAEKSGNPMNWDMVTYPYFKGTEGYGLKKKSFVIGVSSPSKNKEAAFEVLSYLVSKEAQTYLSQNAYVPAMASSDVKNAFGASIPVLKGKNTKAITAVKPFPDSEISVYDDLGQAQIASVFTAVLEGQKDINTILRENNDLLDEAVRKEKAK